MFHRFLDRIEQLLWEDQDKARAADGWQVTKLGRWQRMYRHPALLSAGIRSRTRRPAQSDLERAA